MEKYRLRKWKKKEKANTNKIWVTNGLRRWILNLHNLNLYRINRNINKEEKIIYNRNYKRLMTMLNTMRIKAVIWTAAVILDSLVCASPK